MTWLLKHWTEYTEFPEKDISRSLGALNRYGGQYPEGRRPLSVARHSVLVAELLGDDDPHVLMAALVHDVHECWTGDLLRPFLDNLSHVALWEIEFVKFAIDKCVHNLLGLTLTPEELARVTAADDAACKAELAYLDCPETATDPVIRRLFEAASALLWSPQYDAALWLRGFAMVRKELT